MSEGRAPSDGYGRTPVPSTTSSRGARKLSGRRLAEGSAAQPLQSSRGLLPGDPGRPLTISLEYAPRRGPAGASGEHWLRITYSGGSFWYKGESALLGLLEDVRHGRVRLHQAPARRRGRAKK